jgi:hypothetical protein
VTEQSSVSAPSETKKRGVGFPSMTLQDAVEAVVVAGQHGREHSQDAFATYLGHSTANSGAFRAKLASLRDWGLLERGDRDRVLLSQLATDLVLAAPDGFEDKQLLLAAFESCRPFGMLYGDSAKDVPVDYARIRTSVVMRYGVASEQADKFVDSFVKSAVFAGLAETDGTKVFLFSRGTVFDPAVAVIAESDDSLVPEAISSKATAAASTMTPVIPVALRQAWDIDGGEIVFVIRTAKPMPPEIYALMADMAKTAKEMVQVLVPGDVMTTRTLDETQD